jgi:hypothetical protein
MLRGSLTSVALVTFGVLVGATTLAVFGPGGIAAGSILGAASAFLYLYKNRSVLTSSRSATAAQPTIQSAPDEGHGVLVRDLIGSDYEVVCERLDALEAALAEARTSLRSRR